ncbi:LOW QUALITY PROTEIN: hepatitis A virus cellular receptor 1-like [Equus quagga]|uniref:LOW QUALITY PROTEIN: hepatitis A virus cellular receptor 1-like n=1 Tax=Equus quagga TaxID=89248 RepID=UPI001EE2D464|nr:LOW QUALITY PROTEIN: hepatitis A virus cellular receptor 1-like [Equus quagga]
MKIDAPKGTQLYLKFVTMTLILSLSNLTGSLAFYSHLLLDNYFIPSTSSNFHLFSCSDAIIWTNGSHVTFQKHRHYKAREYLLKENVSLTIENVVKVDGGLYCCHIEHKGSAPMSPRISTSVPPMPAPTQNQEPGATSPSPTWPIKTQPEVLQETRRTQPTSSTVLLSNKWHGRVTQSSNGLKHNNQTQVSLAQNPWMSSTKAVYLVISISAVVLLTFLVVMITRKYFYQKKLQQLDMVSLNGPPVGAWHSESEVHI